jgi:hypothetical protein
MYDREWGCEEGIRERWRVYIQLLYAAPLYSYCINELYIRNVCKAIHMTEIWGVRRGIERGEGAYIQLLYTASLYSNCINELYIRTVCKAI